MGIFASLELKMCDMLVMYSVCVFFTIGSRCIRLDSGPRLVRFPRAAEILAEIRETCPIIRLAYSSAMVIADICVAVLAMHNVNMMVHSFSL